MGNNAALIMSDDCLKSLFDLPRSTQNKVLEFVSKFRGNPRSPGINLEKLNTSDKNMYSVRIDQTYRGIVARQEGNYVLLWVDHHDEAYAWAESKVCRVNSTTGVLQLYNTVQLDESLEAPETQPSRTLFGGISDKDMLQLGAPSELIPYLKSVRDKSAFYESREKLPKDVYENFGLLAEGVDLDEVIDMVRDENPGEQDTAALVSDDFSAAMHNPGSQRYFVSIESEEELRRMLDGPLEEWRVFLHPTQRKIVNRDYSGPARVLGGAGTGKTVVAMHRAKHLASKLGDGGRILFTTFTKNLAEDIKTNLKKICTPEELQKIEVINLDAWVSRFLNNRRFGAWVKYDDEIDPLWEKAVYKVLKTKDNDTAMFCKDEWENIVVPQEAFTAETYKNANRNGFSPKLGRRERGKIWKVFAAYIELMKANKICDIGSAMCVCSKMFESVPEERKYAHVIVDEGQDFSNAAFRLIRTIAGEEHPNDIFIVGDAHQRIYNNCPTLSKCGINVKGRSNVLKINYRTTEETRKFAFALLDGDSFDDLDGGEDNNGFHSLTHGEAPYVKCFSDQTNEVNYLKDEISKLQESGVPLKNICVTARTNNLVKLYSDLLTGSGFNVYQIKGSQAEDSTFDGLRIATMHRVKGLEFQYIFIVSANRDVIPQKTMIRQGAEKAEKCLLYVALTRAQKQAFITCFGRKSNLL